MVSLTATVSACGLGGGDITGKSIRYQVEYTGAPEDELSHTAVFIRYSTNDGEQEQKLVGLPWTKVVGAARPGFKPSVKAQFYGFGTIACRIVANRKVIVQEMSVEGPYSVAVCSV